MHAVVMDSLEEYLSGALEPAAQRPIEAHLNSCGTCREELQTMREVSQLFGSLRSEETWDTSPAFFARVMERVDEQNAVPESSGFFWLDFAFGRRLVFASLLMLAIAGSYLVSRESSSPSDLRSPSAIMAQQNSPAFDSANAQDNMLVTLTTYEH